MKKPIGEEIDELYALEQKIKRIILKRIVPLKERVAKKEEAILKRLQKEKAPSVKGQQAIASIKKTQHANVKNRRLLEKYVAKNKAYDLFTNALSSKAYFDRVAEGEEIPGIEVYTRTSLSLVKRKA